MPHVQPLNRGQIQDAELLALVDRGAALGVPDETFSLILSRAPQHAKAVLRAMLVSHAEGSIDHRLKEIIRVRLARIARDPYFSSLRSHRAQAQGLTEARVSAGCGSSLSDADFTDAEKWALRYARELYLNPENVDAAFYDEGKKHYSEAQIMELGAFIAFHYGMQVFARSLGIGTAAIRKA